MSKFKLPEAFVDDYKSKPVDWGYGALSETVFLRSYSQLKEDGTKERWWECCRRVIEAMFEIQKEHCKTNRLPWNQQKAQRSAKDAFDRMFHFKWTPPGRGLARMGTPIIDKLGNLALMNCSAVTTEDFVGSMEYLMDAALLGVGVGYDTKAAGKHTIHNPQDAGETYVVPDSREGWVEATRKILMGYIHGDPVPQFDYSAIRPKGSPISSGGTAPGPDPLILLHDRLYNLFAEREGETLTIADVVDVGNMIGACIVSGGQRRCLPEGTRVNTTRGSVKIEDIQVGDVVETPLGKAPVTAFFDQGVQSTVLVRHTKGVLECTPNHRVAVYDTPSTWSFKRADELTSDDYLVWDMAGSQGGSNPNLPPSTLPEFFDGFTMDGSEPALPTRVVTVEDGNPGVPTYDIEVEGIHQFTAEGVVVHNSALIALDDSMSDEFLDLKNPEKNPYRQAWAHSSNNSVQAEVGQDLTKIIDGIILNGEPGIVWNEVAQKYGRLIDPPDYAEDGELLVPNPCQPTRALLYSRQGYTTMGAVEVGDEIWSETGWTRIIDKRSSGVKPVFQYTTEMGTFLGTDNHRVVSNGEKIEVKDAKSIDVLPLPNQEPVSGSFNINSVKYLGDEEVFDITVDNATHTYWTAGLNVSNCGEIFLQSRTDKANHKVGGEGCNLSDVNLNKHESLDDFIKTIKYAFLYNKTVTLMTSHNPLTNSLILKNRRIGTSLGGVADFIDIYGMTVFREWADKGYHAIQSWDKTYSEWFCVRESIRTTTIKPSGTTSTLCGESPGVHWNPGGTFYVRRVNMTKGDPILEALRNANYPIEQSAYVPEFEVVEYPVHSQAVRSDLDVSAFEKMMVAAEAQAYWASNAVSCTVSFDPETEGPQLGNLLQMFDGKLKGISFLPRVDGGAYKQMPYEPITKAEYEERIAQLKPLDLSDLYDGKSGKEAEVENFCNSSVCETSSFTTLAETPNDSWDNEVATLLSGETRILLN